MLAIDRANFVPPEYREFAYLDRALSIGHGQTISAPGIVSFMLESMDIKTGMKILEIGTGSGYNAALLSHLAGAKGRVISIEIVPEVFKLGKENIAKVEHILQKNLTLLCIDGSNGYPEKAPYDRIIVTAALQSMESIYVFISQLKEDGKLIAPVSNGSGQDLVLYDNNTKTSNKILPVIFVSLTRHS